MKPIKQYCKVNRKAQTVIELAVFGAILIFVLGMIIKSSMAVSYRQHQALKAMRMAMTTSYIHSSGLSNYGPNYGNSSRNSASVLLIEDRLSVSVDKYGATERTPYIYSGSATYSRNLFMPTDYGETDELPRMDVYVNGKHFAFILARFKEQIIPVKSDYCCDTSDNDTCDNSCTGSGNPASPPSGVEFRDWYFPCIKKTVPNAFGSQTAYYYYGCYRLYKNIPNGLSGWIAQSNVLPAGSTVPSRFDLDRDGVDDVPVSMSFDGAFRQNFSWQWAPVYTVDMKKIRDNSSVLKFVFPVDTYLQGAGIDVDKGKNLVVDVDNDLKEERILELYKNDDYESDLDWENSFITNKGQIKKIRVLDSEDGDIDFSKTKKNADGETIKPGFDFNELSMFTRIFKEGENPTDPTSLGTYYSISEGKLYGSSNGQYYRKIRKKDQIDIIQRVFQLSNNTGRFCSTDVIPQRQTTVDGEPNPVDVCCNGSSCHPSGSGCFDQITSLNLTKTCMDTFSLRIYIRSRVKDARGQKWITKTEDDPYVQFNVNP